jgi:isopenicillin N synthase-like dioxygenase
MPQIPVLDARALTADALLSGLQASSCVFLTGVEALGETLATMLATAREFYALEPAEKSAVRWDGTGPWAGWQPLYEGDGPNALLMERFEYALPAPDRYPDVASWAQAYGPWPQRPAGFAVAWTEYYSAMRALASRLTTLLAEALGVPADDVEAWTDRQHSNLCVNHYLAQSGPPPADRTRQQPHTDIGGITLLWADDEPGLEARIGPGGSWVPVTFPPGALLVQAGDLLHLWSRGTVPANLHRVVNPPHVPGVGQPERYSVVFFHHPDLATWVAPAVPGTEAGDAGTGALEHVLERQRRDYTKTP